jgi:ornithine cyclodeaminase
MFPFHVVGGPAADAILTADRPGVIERVRQTYLAHHDGRTVNPNSYFLTFDDRPGSRIIALPAFTETDERPLAGLKWIASFPSNVELNVPRASAVLLLNDYETGYPFACLEASRISAARTAASAVLGARTLHASRRATAIAVIGAGVIARTIVDFFRSDGWEVERWLVHDHMPAYAEALAGHLRQSGADVQVTLDVAGAVKDADIIVFATTADTPYVLDPSIFHQGQTLLNISLRDLGPEVIASAHNILDDVEHCLNAGTSPHLAVNHFGHRDFLNGTLADLILGDITVDDEKPKIFSPFGLGVLDLAVGHHVYLRSRAEGSALEVPGFFGAVTRW